MLKRTAGEEKKIWNGINKKQGVRIATLNVKGRNKEKKSKWPTIATLMRKQRILVLGLQEMHLDENEADKIRKMCPKIELINNGSSTSKEGIAFVINKELANNMTWSCENMIEGRLSKLTIEVEEERGLDIVLLYAPNGDNDKMNFFNELNNKLRQERKNENIIVMGDFNSVENELDRMPHRKDEKKVTEAWCKVKKSFNLVDGWRVHNELNKGYTYTQLTTNSMSQIDRIYLNYEIYPYGYNWSHVDSAGISDHDLVMVDILKKKLPYIGDGIWRMNQDDIEYERTRKLTDELLRRVENNMKEIKKENKGNIQELWMETKEDIKRIVGDSRRIRKNQLTKAKKNLRKQIDEKLREINNEIEEVRKKNQNELAELKQKLAAKSKHEIKRLQEATRVRYKSKGEKYTKYWFKLNRKKEDSQVILALQKTDGSITNETREMMEIALNHHKELQKKPEMTREREEPIENIKKTMQTRTSNKEKEELKKQTTYEEVKISLKRAPNGSAPGIDGIIYEFYKEKMQNHEKNEDNPDMTGILHMVINDIKVNGLKRMNKENESRKKEYTDGIMHLLFKKKEKWKIANYRPIMLLNTDYKTYTITIALRLAEVAKNMIHEDQAGFVPKRSLYDHTKTTNLAIEYCEMMDRNGCIIALDQEKAYDKIDHEYLWKIMEHYEFPEEFINRIKELYKNTGKAIIVNGVMTKQYKVGRGIHQGDPMSCLLYNFAIEPLADAIRSSNLKGIGINEDVDRLIVSLFADDTLVYLGEEDDLKKLQQIINTFCKASTARLIWKKQNTYQLEAKYLENKL